MGNKNIRRNINMENGLHSFNDSRNYKSQRFYERHGINIYSSPRNNNSKMGEIAKAFLNTLGWTAVLMGIVTNLNNWISLSVGAVGMAFAIYKTLNEREVWLAKRDERIAKKKSR